MILLNSMTSYNGSLAVAEFYNLLSRSNFCNGYEESSSASNFNTPQSYCNGPSNANFGGISGYGAAATPSLSSQFGFRFSF